MDDKGDRPMTVHREEGALTIRIDLSAEFGEDYEGDDDGLAWLERFRSEVQPSVVRALFDALRAGAKGKYDVLPVSRGRSPDENVDVEVRWKP